MNYDEFENESDSSSVYSGNDLTDSDIDNEYSGNEEEIGSSRSEGTSEVDYSELLTNIDGNIDNISSQIEVFNDNVIVLNDNLKFCTSLLFVVVFFLMIKLVYHILGSVLGLNKA